jgi:hypothetical protein
MTEDLAFDLGQCGQMVGVDENVPPVLERCEQRRRLLEVETATLWRPGAWRHCPRTVGDGTAGAALERRAPAGGERFDERVFPPASLPDPLRT